MKKTILAYTFILLMVFINPLDIHSQKSKSKKKDEDKIKIDVKGNGAILENGNLRGYYVYMAVDKEYGKQQNYHIELYDENFSQLNTIKYKAGVKIGILGCAYSSDELCFMFLNSEAKSFDYKIFDIEGKLVSEHASQMSNKDFKKYMKFVTSERITSVEGGGFLSTSTVTDKAKVSFKVNKFVKGQKKPIEYKFQADKKFNLPSILGVTNNTIVMSVRSSKAQLGPAKYHLIGLNKDNMKLKFHLDSDQDGENLFVPYSLIENPDYNTIKLSGTYFNVNGNTNKHSKGLAMWELDSSGLLLSEKYNSWSTDFNNTLSFNSNGKVKKLGFLKIHETFSTRDGKTFAVAEGYRKRFNGWGLLTCTLLIWPSFLTKYQTTDLVLFELSKDFKVTKANVFNKQVNSWAAYGMTTAGIHSIANKIPYMFGYRYAQMNEERDAFMFTYNENHFRLSAFNKKPYSFNTVKFENGKLTTDKLIPKKQAWFSTSNYYMPSQFGKIANYTYNYETKKSEFNIIKVK